MKKQVESGTPATDRLAFNRTRILMEEAVAQELLRSLGSSSIELSAYSLETIADRALEAGLTAARQQGFELRPLERP